MDNVRNMLFENEIKLKTNQVLPQIVPEILIVMIRLKVFSYMVIMSFYVCSYLLISLSFSLNQYSRFEDLAIFSFEWEN